LLLFIFMLSALASAFVNVQHYFRGAVLSPVQGTWLYHSQVNSCGECRTNVASP